MSAVPSGAVGLVALFVVFALSATALPIKAYAHPAGSAITTSGVQQALAEAARHHVSRLKRYRRRR